MTKVQEGRYVPMDELKELNGKPLLPVLLVDDSSVYRQRTGHILTQLGLPFRVVSSGREATVYLAQQQVSLILMDLQMPETDGFQLAQLIRQEGQNAAVPIIAISPERDNSTRKKAIRAGMNDFLEKPVKQEELRAILKKWLSVEQEQTPVGEVPCSQERPQLDKRDLVHGLDFGLLREMFSPDDQDSGYLNNFIDIFIDEVSRRIISLQQALVEGDLQTGRLEAHAVKGASLSVGAALMAERFAELEKSLRQEKVDQVKKNLRHAEAEYHKTLVELKKMAKGEIKLF